MEEVLNRLESTFLAPLQTPKTEYDVLYKNWGKLKNQEERRREILENQKLKRQNNVDSCRGILELMNAVEEDEIFKRDQQYRTHYRPTIYVAGFHKVPISYCNILMMSEWLIERPADFHENWYVTAAPKAYRMLVIAHGGKTKFYTKHGVLKFVVQSQLPSGSHYDPHKNKKNSCCILEGFYQEEQNTLYVLDFLSWNNQPMTDCEAEFRNFWLQSKFAEKPELGTVNKKNEVKFVLLPKIPCTPEKLNEFMMTWPPFGDLYPLVDGLLFYHKEGHYSSGPTPLVGWLYPYMVQEVLGADITVNKAYSIQKPDDYVDQATFIKQFEDRKRKIKKTRVPMDTSDASKTESKEGVSSMEAEQTAEKTSTDSEKLEMDSSNVTLQN